MNGSALQAVGLGHAKNARLGSGPLDRLQDQVGALH